MPRKRNVVPSYLRHKPSGQAFVTLTGPDGRKRFDYLGPYGSEESRREYARIVAEVGGQVPTAPPAYLTVNEVIARFREHVERHYRHPDGTPTDEQNNYRVSLRPLRELYGLTLAREFGPTALKAVRRAMIGKGWCRNQINARVNRVRRMFKWAASEELVPTAVYVGLTTVAGLQAGRSDAKEREPVRPVAVEHVAATLPFLNRHVAGLVRFQLYTGCRPGEARRVRRCDIDTTSPVWVYRPPTHKNAWRGKKRVIAVGPKAQALLAEFFTDDPGDYLFSPRRAVREFHAARAAARRTPKYPSHMRWNAEKRMGEAAHADKYTATAYDPAVTRAVERADRRRAALAAGGGFDPVPHWHPNQLRHTHGTRVREKHGLEAAQAALGHDRMSTTEVYAEKKLALALKVAAADG